VKQICSPKELTNRFKQSTERGENIDAVIVIDDLIATGKTFAGNISSCVDQFGDELKKSKAKLIGGALYATKEGSEYVLRAMKSLTEVECDLRVGEILSPDVYAFHKDSVIWSSQDERERAKALISDLGSRVYKTQPLGYGGLGLLLVFPTTVPNNTLPILHSSAKSGQKPWRPLFIRPTN
jgi:hypothetical protein